MRKKRGDGAKIEVRRGKIKAVEAEKLKKF
jgi:hypothetical protein